MEYLFEIPIGDWSGDGHDKCDYYKYKSNKPIEDIRNAYFKAAEILGKAYPEIICSEYEESMVEEDMIQELEEKGFTIADEFLNKETLLSLIEWFIKVGDKDIILEQIPKEQIPMFPFYGFDNQKRHIGFFGYGLFD